MSIKAQLLKMKNTGFAFSFVELLSFFLCTVEKVIIMLNIKKLVKNFLY